MAAENRQLTEGLTDDGYRRLVERSPDSICVHARGRVVFVNDAGVRLMLADSSEQLVGRPITDFVATESLPPMVSGIASLREVGDCTPPYQAQMLRFDGSRLAVEVVVVMTTWRDQPAHQVITRDVSARHAAEAALRYQAALVNHVSDAIIGTTATGVVTSWNPAAESVYGRSCADAIGRQIGEVVGAAVDPAAVMAAGGIVHRTHRSAAGAPLHVRVSAAAMEDGYVFVCCDLTALRRAEQHFETVVDSMTEGVIVTDRHGGIKSINPAAVHIMGTGSEHIGRNFFEITGPMPFYDHDGVNIPPDRRPAWLVLHTGVPFINRVFGFDRLGTDRIWLLSSCRLLNPEMPGQSDLLMSFSDVTAERAVADKTMFFATHDALTQLPNRASVLRRLKKALARTDQNDPLRWVLFIDLDGLKSTNDTLGHTAGDELLRVAAARLGRLVAPDDMAGRLGGDEFVVLVFRDLTRGELDDVIERMRLELAAPVAVGAVSVPINASIGVVEVHRGDERTADEVLRDADFAMYEAKRARRSRGG